jgi:hypothetical protein
MARLSSQRKAGCARGLDELSRRSRFWSNTQSSPRPDRSKPGRSVALSASQKVTGSASRASHESQADRNPGAIVQPGLEHDALARSGHADDEGQRQPGGRVERRVRMRMRDVPIGERRDQGLRRGQRPFGQAPPGVRNHPQRGDSRSPDLTLGSGQEGAAELVVAPSQRIGAGRGCGGGRVLHPDPAAKPRGVPASRR